MHVYVHTLHGIALTLSQCRSYGGTDTFFSSSAARSIILHHELEELDYRDEYLSIKSTNSAYQFNYPMERHLL